MSYCIGSLNLRGGKRAQRHQRDFYEFIYQIIFDENITLFAFQEDAEIRNNSIIDDLLGIGTTPLSQRGWEGFHMPGPDKSSEFSFIWDANKIQPTTVPGVFRNADNVQILREPLCGDFSVIVGNSGAAFPYEFRLINIHLWHGGGRENRMRECGHVKGEIYEKIQSRIPDSIRHIFTVALGDYNLDCDEANLCEPGRIKTFQEEHTTINANGNYCNSYDHFSVDIIHNESVNHKPMRIDVLQYCPSMEFYHQNVSDHVPIKLEIF